MLLIYTHPSYIVCGRLFWTLFIIPPSCLASSFPVYRNFSKGARKNLCQHVFHQITTPPLASPRHPRPKYDILDYTPGRKLKITAFRRGDVWDLNVSLSSNFHTYVNINSNDSGTKFKRSWGHMCNYCWKMLLNKKQLEFVQQHLHVKTWSYTCVWAQVELDKSTWQVAPVKLTCHPRSPPAPLQITWQVTAYRVNLSSQLAWWPP